MCGLFFSSGKMLPEKARGASAGDFSRAQKEPVGIRRRQLRHWPAGRSPSQKLPMRTRSSRRVGWPMAAVIRRTCRFLPRRVPGQSKCRNALAETDGRNAWRDLRRAPHPVPLPIRWGEGGDRPVRGFELPSAAAPAARRGRAAFCGLESKFPSPVSANFPATNFSHCAQYSPLVRVARVPGSFSFQCASSPQQQQAFGIRVQPANRINILENQTPPAHGSASRRR